MGAYYQISVHLGCSVSEEKIFWKSTNQKQELHVVAMFVNEVNYHRKHIPGYSNLALPLHKVVLLTMPFVWEETNQLLNLREALINSAILNFPNLTGMYILDNDAFGAAFSQLQNEEEK
jgi:hypothetical protein